MSPFAQLVEYVQAHYPVYAYVLQAREQIAVDGLIFRPISDTGLLFVGEAGETEVSLDEAIEILAQDRIENQ